MEREPSITTYLEDDEDENSRVFVLRFGVEDLQRLTDMCEGAPGGPGIKSAEFCVTLQDLIEQYAMGKAADAAEPVEIKLTVTADPAEASTLATDILNLKPGVSIHGIATSKLYLSNKDAAADARPNGTTELLHALYMVAVAGANPMNLHVEDLSCAFFWDKTPQGEDYWRKFDADIRAARTAAAIDEDWVLNESKVYKTHKAQLIALGEELHDEFVREFAKARRHLLETGQRFEDDKADMDVCMAWRQTPQGHDYWAKWWRDHMLHKWRSTK